MNQTKAIIFDAETIFVSLKNIQTETPELLSFYKDTMEGLLQDCNIYHYQGTNGSELYMSVLYDIKGDILENLPHIYDPDQNVLRGADINPDSPDWLPIVSELNPEKARKGIESTFEIEQASHAAFVTNNPDLAELAQHNGLSIFLVTEDKKEYLEASLRLWAYDGWERNPRFHSEEDLRPMGPAVSLALTLD